MKSFLLLVLLVALAGAVGFTWLGSQDLSVNRKAITPAVVRPTAPVAPIKLGEPRLLTNKKGKRINAQLITKNGNNLTIIANGKQYNLSIDTLSERDQQFLRTWKPK